MRAPGTATDHVLVMQDDKLEGGFRIERYHSYTCGTVCAVIEVVQIGTRIGGSYRFERHDNGEVLWNDWPRENGEVSGEELIAEPTHRAPDGTPWRWRLNLAGVHCFARRVEGGRIGVALREESTRFDDYLEPILVAPEGEPFRALVRHAQALIGHSGSTHPRAAELRTAIVSSIAATLDAHPVLRAAIPDAIRLVGGEHVDLHMLREAAEREAARAERAYFDTMRASWAPRLASGTAPSATASRSSAAPQTAETILASARPHDVGVGELVDAAKALVAAQNIHRGELLVVVRDVSTGSDTHAIGPTFDTAAVAAAVARVPFETLASVDGAWTALRAGLPASLAEPEKRGRVRALPFADLRAALEGWYAATFQSPSEAERRRFVDAASGYRLVGGFEAVAARFAVLTGETTALLVFYVGDGP